MIIKRRFLLPILLCWPFVSMGVDISTIQSAQTIDAALFHAEVALEKLNLTEEQKSEIKQKLQDIATVAKQPPEPANPETEEETVAQEPDPDQCPPTYDKNGKQLNRLKSINENTRVGDFCSSSYIAVGKVKWYSKLVNGQKVCTCLASVCTDGNHVEKGRCVEDVAELATCPRQEYKSVSDVKTDEDALSFCETKGGKQCKTIGALKDYNGVKGLIICNPTKEESGIADQRTEDQKLHYYNCGDTRQIPSGISCSYVSDFSGYKITPLEADGLMKEYALKKYKDDIKCDEKSHRIQNDGNNYRQCASRKNDKQFYEFKFKDLDAGNSGFTDALCLIWGLKGGMNLCKNASQAQCQEISAAINRTFYIGGDAKLNGTNCIINSHPRAESAPVAVLNTHVITKEDMRTVGTIDPLHLYDKKLQVNANADVYQTITNYLFVEQRLPVKQFSCGAGFVDNIMYYNVSRQKYNETQEKIRKCQQNSQNYSGGGEHAVQGMGGAMLSCNRQYPLDSKSGDLLTCEYDGKPIDFLFKKLDVKWNRKSTAGYQGLLCLSEGGSFTGKSCTLANRQQCDDFNARFKKDYPNSKGMEWDDDLGTCVLKDAKYVSNVQKVAEVSGMVALTLVTAVAGGPVVWGLSVVEGAALVTEAVTEGKLSNWSDKFISDATQCSDNDSGCANAVLKKHIARIIKGSKYFDETQGKAIAKQTTRLMGMLSSDTYNQINDKVPDGINLQNDKERDTVLENAILGYYGTKLTSDEKALLTTKKVATVLTFATLIGGGVMAGLRQGVKRNLFKISKARQAKWLDLKILKPGDVADDVVAMSKTGQKSAATAVKTAPAAGKSWEEELAEIGVKEEKTASGAVRYKDTKNGKYISKDEVLKRIDNMPGKTAIPKPVETSPSPKPEGTKPVTKPVTPQSRVYEKLGDKTKADIADIKSGKYKELYIPKGQLTDEEWKILKEDLAKDGLELREQGTLHYLIEKAPASPVKSATGSVDVARTTGKADDAAKGTAKTMNVSYKEGKQLVKAGKWADATVLDPTFDIKVTPLELGGKKYYLKAGDTETLIQNEISRTKQAHELLKHNKIVTSVGVVEDDQTVLKAFMDAHPDITLPRTPDTQYFIMEATHANTVEGLSDAEILGYLRNKPITIEEQNTILSEIQNMNNNGLIHNDIWHNFAIYRDSGGKLHMELMDFGDFTAEDKLLRSNDDVLEIKKLFSKWSDRGLVEKGVAKKADNISVATSSVSTPKGAASTASKSASKADDVVAISATQAKASNVATLRQSASKSFDKYLAEVKTSPTGKGAKLPKSRLNDAGWNEVNKSLAGDNVQLVDTGDGYMQFVRANHVDDEVEVVGVVSKPSASTASKSAGKAENVATSAVKAQAPSITDLRQTASKNFDTYLAEAKTSTSGKSAHKIPKSRLNDAEWDAINKSLASENVQLVDTGDGYMQFVRANHVDDGAEIIAEVVPDVFDARKMRVSDGSGKLYVRNSASEMLGYPVNGDDAVNEVNQLYGTIRRGIEYPVNDTKVSRAINAMEKPNNNAILYRAPTNNYNWHVHSYNGPRGSSAEVQYHVSLNVEVDDALIKKLDDIMAKDQGQHIVDFKIPPVGSRWKTMADPISIYMRGTNPEIERAIAAAAKPYVRTSSEIGLLGRKIDDGVAIAYETSAARMDIVEDIINQVARKDTGVAAKLRAEGRYSVGETEALRLWASDFLGYTIAPVIP